MKPKLTLMLLLLSLFWAPVLAQGPVQEWTDKNNTEMYAAYMLRLAYNERGYAGAHVDLKQDAGRAFFIVDPGPVYRLSEVAIIGLPQNNIDQELRDGPKAGEVYSAARINDWVAGVRRKYAAEHRNGKVVFDRVQFDRVHAQAAVTLVFK